MSFTTVSTYLSCCLIIGFGHLRDFFRGILVLPFTDDNLQVRHLGYAPICLEHEDFYIRRGYHRVQDCFARPIASAPDAWFDVVERDWNDEEKVLDRTTESRRCLNLGSYNYLGFGSFDEYCTPRVIESLEKFSASTCSSRVDAGTTSVHVELEESVAKYVGKHSAIVFGMGYATNSAIIPVLIGKGGLIISDSLNHSSIINGARGSGANIRVFQHNTPSHLERILREEIAERQTKTHKPWKKIIVIVEGRGVCELLGVNTADVDIMMGTFTKSFASCGGYIAGSKELIQYLRYHCPAHLYATSISTPSAQQIISAIKVILGEDGSNRGEQKLARIRENSNFFRAELQKMGFEVLGDNDSPVMPIMLYHPAKIPAFSRECFRENIAIAVVGFPATPLMLGRARICISASHSKQDLIKALEIISKVGDLTGIK
ncbi:unnamed protein product [Eruca vesicaria subsp. sativa]|uniref:Aminotransferase class I/classII large domain-containing protein n=1 Tax=Eruca vesicaria subsp. sativa TaxID=29727 RepID=A0ABC8LSE3_ERUVS|nr:unnamed protein product [Eruca vesicaria subsp. sativa]